MEKDPLDGLIPDPVREMELPPQPKAKRQPPTASLDGLVEEGELKEVIVPAEKEPQSAPQGTVLDGLLDGAKLEEESMEKEAESDKITAQITQLQTLEKQEKPSGASGEKTEKDASDAEDSYESEEPDAPLQSKAEAYQSIQGPLSVEAKRVEALEPLRVLEAALFLANKPLSYKQMQDILQVPAARIQQLLGQLAMQIPPESAVQLAITEHSACLQLKPQYLERVSHLSKEVELSRKSMRILALVAKKKQMLQSELRHFFKGEIYAYVTELRESGYIDSKKQGNTRLLKPSSKFFDSFQFKEPASVG